MRTALRMAALAVAVAAVAMWFIVEPAGAWTDGACADATGVTVVVDFHQLGGGVVVRCAPGPVTSGFGALAGAGFAQRAALRSSGFLCRIGLDENRLEPADDPCVDASPANAYWSYWHADRGGSWIYGDLGGGNRTPPAGSIEGWSFAQNASGSNLPRPGIDPPPLTVTTVPPTTVLVRSPSASPRPIAPATTAPPRSAATLTVPPGSPSTTTTVAAAVAPALDSTSTSTAASTTTSVATRVESATAQRVRVTSSDDSAAPVGTIVGIGGVVLLGAGAAVGAKRRRSAEP